MRGTRPQGNNGQAGEKWKQMQIQHQQQGFRYNQPPPPPGQPPLAASPSPLRPPTITVRPQIHAEPPPRMQYPSPTRPPPSRPVRPPLSRLTRPLYSDGLQVL